MRNQLIVASIKWKFPGAQFVVDGDSLSFLDGRPSMSNEEIDSNIESYKEANPNWSVPQDAYRHEDGLTVRLSFDSLNEFQTILAIASNLEPPVASVKIHTYDGSTKEIDIPKLKELLSGLYKELYK